MNGLGASAGLMPAEAVVFEQSVVEYFIPGTPVQQGSKNGRVQGSRAVIYDQNAKKLKPWRSIVAFHSNRGVTFDCPVHVELTFVMPRPHRPEFNVPAVRPDIDKLVRAVFDGITDGGLWKDDARVVRLLAVEEYASETNPVGVHVAVVAA